MATEAEIEETAFPDGGAVVAHATDEAGAPHPHKHPTEGQYVLIALLLAAITGVEVAVYYISALGDLLVPLLLLFAIVKFSVVVAFFMHLRFDSRLFRRLFVLGLGLAIFVFTVVLTTFHFWSR
ncbi:MAG TPA: cytochrome C oxidase subunit IV family protein [Acidimicrobiales bacterium]|jgi:cytochrome c oxidase subunit 4|nr:cytochrome C oxidase subunit IV family protein [Acidimicrobiales bacterium]